MLVRPGGAEVDHEDGLLRDYAVTLPEIVGIAFPVRCKGKHRAGHEIFLLPAQRHEGSEIAPDLVRVGYVRSHFRHEERIALVALVDAYAVLAAS